MIRACRSCGVELGKIHKVSCPFNGTSYDLVVLSQCQSAAEEQREPLAGQSLRRETWRDLGYGDE